MNKSTEIHITNSQGVVLSLAEHMQNVTTQVAQNLQRSEQPAEVRQLVEQLSRQIKEISPAVPPASVEKMTKSVTRLSEELALPKPDKEWCHLSLKGIKEAAEAVGAVAAPVLEIVLKLWPLVV